MTAPVFPHSFGLRIEMDRAVNYRCAVNYRAVSGGSWCGGSGPPGTHNRHAVIRTRIAVRRVHRYLGSQVLPGYLRQRPPFICDCGGVRAHRFEFKLAEMRELPCQ